MTGPAYALTRPDPALARGVFRAVLNALARPGRATELPQLDGVPAVLIPLLALADLDTPVCLLEDAGSGADPHASSVPAEAGDADPAVPAGVAGAFAGGLWSAQVAAATSATVATLPDARLVAALRPVTLAELRALRRGAPSAPEQAALAALAVSDLDGGPRLWLSGPGTGPSAALTVAGLPDRWWTARGSFPLGADLLLITSDGRCVGVPRSSALTTEKDG